jgi:3-methylcrotonyl-CoA carboxylase alpha subunit
VFGKVLIANRGEIACRVIRTARRLSIATVAVYSDADALALHVALADEAYAIGSAPARDSYLRIDAILDAATRSGAEAVHPGYGFLAENAAFAEACAAAGIIFIGPPAAAIRAMGSKSAAKALMDDAGVPLVPGYHGAEQDDATLASTARRIGFPLLIKPSAGGGGKGMRVVERAEDFLDALAAARREAASAFGDDTVLLERYLARPRHIEIQVFADAHGNTVSLFERDCSIQRRHQKIVEESPATGLSVEQREQMGAAAIAVARAVGYVGAGTVEFLHQHDRFYFMEMNTRLQVEHPVTELVTGQDLVEWQFRVAAGETLPTQQPELRMRGHAIEARIYAEDPARDFLPSIGRLAHLRQPLASGSVRVDTGVRAGDAISAYYDPMIAKLVVWGDDRADAVRRLAAALAEYEVLGVATNLPLLRAIAAHSAFVRGDVHTGFIAQHPELLEQPATDPSALALAAAALRVLLDRQRDTAATAALSGDPFSPWATIDAWRPNLPGTQEVVLRSGGEPLTVRAAAVGAGRWELELRDRVHAASAVDQDDRLCIELDGVQRRVSVLAEPSEATTAPGRIAVFVDGWAFTFDYVDPLEPPRAEAAGGGRISAPIPGNVTKLMIGPGDAVKRGQPLLVLEAMKMELTLTAPADGVIEAVNAKVGEMVEEGRELVLLAPGA